MTFWPCLTYKLSTLSGIEGGINYRQIVWIGSRSTCMSEQKFMMIIHNVVTYLVDTVAVLRVSLRLLRVDSMAIARFFSFLNNFLFLLYFFFWALVWPWDNFCKGFCISLLIRNLNQTGETCEEKEKSQEPHSWSVRRGLTEGARTFDIRCPSFKLFIFIFTDITTPCQSEYLLWQNMCLVFSIDSQAILDIRLVYYLCFLTKIFWFMLRKKWLYYTTKHIGKTLNVNI